MCVIFFNVLMINKIIEKNVKNIFEAPAKDITIYDILSILIIKLVT